MIIKNKVNETELKEFILSLSSKTKKTFNYFDNISKKTIREIVSNEILRNDKMKFFAFEKNELIGYGFLTLFNKSSKKHNCILGIVIADKMQNKGIGKVICKKMIREAWKNKLTKIWLTVHEDNLTAIKLYKQLGFQLEGIFMDDENHDGNYKNILSLALFKNNLDYREKRLEISKIFEL